MKNIAIITQYVSMPGEKSNGRFRYISNLLADANYKVELITTNFSHRDKKHRTYVEDIEKRIQYKFTMLDEPGYKKNISLKRFYSHYVFAQNLKKYLKTLENIDCLYCAIPSLSAAKVVAKFAKKNNIRFVIDIQDLWPEAFKMVFNVPLISDILFYPMKKVADYVYKSADDIVAVSETYLNRALKINKIAKNKISIFLGTDLDYFDKSHNEHEMITFDNVFRIAYIGTLGNSYDIKCVIDAIKILKDKGINNILFEIIGSGPLKIEFEKYAKQKGVNCEFTGRLNYEEMVGYLCICDIAVNPIKKDSAASIINKVGDYAAAGIPVLNTQESIEYKKLVEDYQIGYNIENGNSEDLAEAIEYLYKNEDLRKKLGKNNRRLAEEKFDRKITYLKIKEIFEKE